MKCIFIILFTAFFVSVHAQTDSTVYRTDTVIKFFGIDTIKHQHNYASSEIMRGDQWITKDIICTICLRNCTATWGWWYEKRTDPYQEAKKRLRQYFKATNY